MGEEAKSVGELGVREDGEEEEDDDEKRDAYKSGQKKDGNTQVSFCVYSCRERELSRKRDFLCSCRERELSRKRDFLCSCRERE